MAPKSTQDLIGCARPTAVLVDLDDTLYDYPVAHQAGLAAVGAKAERLLGITAEDFLRAYALAREETKKRLGRTASSHSRLLYFQGAIEELGLRTQVLMTLDFEQTYWRNFLTAAKLRPGVREFFAQLRQLDVPTALVTDQTAVIQFRKLIYFELHEAFDAVVTSEEVGADKPSPTIFQRALEKLGVGEGPYWMIGDDCERDFGASLPGLTTFQQRVRSHESKLPAPNCLFDEFGDLTQLVASTVTGTNMPLPRNPVPINAPAGPTKGKLSLL